MTEHPGLARLAAVISVAGSVCAIAGTFLPWIMATDPEAGATLSRAGIDGHYAMLVDLLAVISIGIAGIVLLRGWAPAAVPVILTSSALVQLGLVIFVGTNLARGVTQLEAAGAHAGLGVGLYLAASGAAVAIAGGAFMWVQRSRSAPSRIP